jgi:glucan phosphoethanolaminetransferase (alkaline phosphatase superfamily)
LLLLFFFQLPITYKTQDVAAIRTLLPISILFVVYGLYLVYNIRQVELFRLRIPLSFIKLVLVGIILFNTWNLVTQHKITQNYADKYDKRIEYINQMSSMDTLILEPLPNSGFLYSSEISFNSEHYTNQHLRNGLQTKSELMLRKTEHK